MLYANAVIPIVLLIICFMCFPLLIQFVIRSRVRGKHLCAIVDKGRPVVFKLLKIVDDDFVKDNKDQWALKTHLMKPVDYPIGWPRVLHPFQQSVWCSLVMRGRSEPLDWEEPAVGALSSKELPVILDPRWLINLVKGVGEEGKSSKGERMLMYLAVGASVLGLVVMFYLVSKIGAIEQAVNALRAVVR